MRWNPSSCPLGLGDVTALPTSEWPICWPMASRSGRRAASYAMTTRIRPRTCSVSSTEKPSPSKRPRQNPSEETGAESVSRLTWPEPLRALRDDFRTRAGEECFTELSMGMSADLEVAECVDQGGDELGFALAGGQEVVESRDHSRQE